MKKINNAYLATPKDGSTEEILKKLPPRKAGYSALYTSLPPKEAEKLLHMLSGIDEDLLSTMMIPLSLFFTMTPREAMDSLVDKSVGLQYHFDTFMQRTLSEITDWLANNKTMINELLAYCDGIFIEDLEEDWFKIENYKTTPEIEKAFIEDAEDNKDKAKRIKLLAAMDVICQHQDTLIALEKNYASDAFLLGFLLTRSLAQFAAQKTVMDGISVQKGRRNQKPVKKPGFTALRKHFKAKYPKASEAMLWKLIKRDIRDNPFEHGDYTIEYRADETDVFRQIRRP